METNKWYSIRNLSLAVATREAGFDLAIYDDYSESVQAELRRRTIESAMLQIETGFSQIDIDIYDIKKGVYVISLSSPLTISYDSDTSQVIYIGMGNIMSRVKQHFEGKLFDFMQSLSGANFDFSFACPDGKIADYYKHVEWEMLEYFSRKFGGLSEKRRFPIMNKNAGSNRELDLGDEWWKSPLKKNGRRPWWALKPTTFSEFGTLD